MTDIERDNLLLSISQNMLEFREELKSQRQDMAILEATLSNKIDNQINELREELESLRQDMAVLETTLSDKIDNQINELREELKSLRQDMAILEVTLSDKIDALFDVRQINSEKFEEHDEEIQKINLTLDRHHSDILYLKSKIG